MLHLEKDWIRECVAIKAERQELRKIVENVINKLNYFSDKFPEQMKEDIDEVMGYIKERDYDKLMEIVKTYEEMNANAEFYQRARENDESVIYER